MNKLPDEQLLLFIKDVEKITGCNRMTLRRWWTAGYFPQPTKLNGNMLVWHREAIDQWINDNTKRVVNPAL
jgi:prophage regulatory protein